LTILTLTKVDVGMMEDVGTSANNIIQLDSNAKIPAVDGSLLTGTDTALSASSDPTISTNPTNGVGTKYRNTTSGEMYICTDATAGENVWTNVGGGTGDIKPWEFGGSSYGFMCANQAGLHINRFSFTSDGGGTDWGDLAGTSRYGKSGHSDKDNSYGYHSGGYGPPINEIARFSFTSSGTSNDVGDLTQITSAAASATNATHCYSVGHEYNAGGGGDGTVVSRWAFASSVNASDWCDLMGQQYGGGGATNGAGTYGYIQGGGAPTMDRIQKVNLTSQATATDVGNITNNRHSSAGNSSATYGYCAAGHGPPNYNIIDKFSFATDGDSTDVGDLTIAIHQRGGASSLTYGYVCGGSGTVNVIEKHSFTTDGNATDVGDLAQGFTSPSGSQY